MKKILLFVLLIGLCVSQVEISEEEVPLFEKSNRLPFLPEIIIPEEEVPLLEFPVEDLFKCLYQSEPLVRDVMALINAIKTKNYLDIIHIVYKSIGDSKDLFNQCIKLIPSLEEYIKKLIKINLDDFVKCIVDTEVVVKDVIEIVKILKEKNYDRAVVLIYQMLKSGEGIVIECINVFK